MDEKNLLDELKVLAKDEGFMEELFTTENHTEFAEKLKTKNNMHFIFIKFYHKTK